MKDMAERVRGYTAFRLKRLAEMPENACGAALARLRRGVGRRPGAQPELWGEFLQDMPEEMYSPTGEPSRAEWAVYTALTLYALHQQGRNVKTEPMNCGGTGIGAAAARLVHSEEDRERIWRRFHQAASAGDLIELSHYLRGMIQLLRAEGIGLDYTALAAELYWYQIPSGADRVRLRWGQDFFRGKADAGGENGMPVGTG